MSHKTVPLVVLFVVGALLANREQTERTEGFDRDPGWEGVNNRSVEPKPRTVTQDFGWSPTSHAGRAKGEIGGLITPAAETAYYGRKIPRRTLNDRLSASGVIACPDRQFHLLIGFFNSSTLNEWRTPNTIAMRLLGRGDHFIGFLEYCTQRWRAGGDSPRGFAAKDSETGKQAAIKFPNGTAVHTWSIDYDPSGTGGAGAITATIDGKTARCNLESGHRADGASFDHFGLLPIFKSVDGGGHVWLDDIMVDGVKDTVERDPRWDEYRNRRTYVTAEVRPWFDFGFSPTNFAGGKAPGELGGLIFRGDGRYRDKMAWYADRIGPLSLEKPLRAGGRICMRRGVSDSTTLLGFFNSKTSTAIYDAQDTGFPDDFLGIAIEGPSSEGFFVYPACRAGRQARSNYGDRTLNRIYPDGKSHDWQLEYTPTGNGSVRVSLDNQSLKLDLDPVHKAAGARFDRFGLVTTRIDGNAQRVYFDDLTYTVRQD
jgi:hypothetical protein